MMTSYYYIYIHMQSAYINFTYNSPHEDIESSLGFNNDGSINVKYTLNTMKNILTYNLSIINKLLDKVDTIKNIESVGYNKIEIAITSKNDFENLIKDNVLFTQPIIDQPDENDINFSDDEETNQDRLNMINNMVNKNDFQAIFDKHSDSESDKESDDIISDEKNTKSILSKYSNFIKDEEDTDSEDSATESDY